MKVLPAPGRNGEALLWACSPRLFLHLSLSYSHPPLQLASQALSHDLPERWDHKKSH